MGIRCQHCKMENEQGVMFCRNCGQKIDPELIEREVRKYLEAKPVEVCRSCSWIKKLAYLFLLVSACYVCYAIVDPFEIRPSADLSLEDSAFAVATYREMKNNTKGVYTLSLPQTNYIVNKYFLPQGKEDSPVYISVSADQKLCFSIDKTICKYIKWKITLTAIGTPVVTGIPPDDVMLTIKLSTIKLGKLSLPRVIGKYFIKDFAEYCSVRKLGPFCSSIYKLEVGNNGLVIHFNHE